MLGLLLAMALAAPPRGGPSAADTARLYFLAGDVARAVEAARSGLKSEPACKPMIKALAEYGFLLGHEDTLTTAEARSLLALDAQIAPLAIGRATEPVLTRFVTRPLETARAWLKGGDVTRARALLEQVLIVDPTNAEARALLAPDAGTHQEARDGRH